MVFGNLYFICLFYPPPPPSSDSNTMDSTLDSESRHHTMRGSSMKRQHEDHGEHLGVGMADAEGSETEESNNSSATSKRRRCRGPRVRACNEGDDEDSRKMAGQGTYPGRRRRRHSSSRGGKAPLLLLYLIFLCLRLLF